MADLPDDLWLYVIRFWCQNDASDKWFGTRMKVVGGFDVQTAINQAKNSLLGDKVFKENGAPEDGHIIRACLYGVVRGSPVHLVPGTIAVDQAIKQGQITITTHEVRAPGTGVGDLADEETGNVDDGYGDQGLPGQGPTDTGSA